MPISNAKKYIYAEVKTNGLLYTIWSGIQSIYKEFQRNLSRYLRIQGDCFQAGLSCQDQRFRSAYRQSWKRKTPVIIIDEANYINNAILNDLKILFNFEMDSRDRAAILLAGLPKLNSTLGLGIHEPLKQRIVMNYNLEGLTKEEGHNYITEKLKGAGCNQTVFEDAAMEAILNAADGTPRMINKYCNQSMLIGDSNKANLITTDIVMQAINDCELG